MSGTKISDQNVRDILRTFIAEFSRVRQKFLAAEKFSSLSTETQNWIVFSRITMQTATNPKFPGYYPAIRKPCREVCIQLFACVAEQGEQRSRIVSLKMKLKKLKISFFHLTNDFALELKSFGKSLCCSFSLLFQNAHVICCFFLLRDSNNIK